LTLGILVALVFLSGMPAESAIITGELANFDVHNFTDYDVNDFVLVLQGIGCGDICYIWNPGGGYYDSLRCWEEADGTHIKWWFPPIPWCEWKHFGVQLNAGVPAPIVVFAAWTVDCEPVAVIPFPWQRWVGSVECPVWDIIPGNPGTIPPEGVLISRRAALLVEEIPLDNLQRDDPMVRDVQWQYIDEIPQVLYPDSVLVLEMVTSGEVAALVEYTVEGFDGTEYMVFLSEAWFVSEPSATSESTWGRIKTLFR
jgi:hypothetical protein